MTLLRVFFLATACLLTFTVGISLSYVLLMHNSYMVSETIFSGYISGAGGFLGGVAGGLVAFGVTRSQFNQDKQKEKDKQLTAYKNILRALLNELSHNQTILKILTTNLKDKQPYINSLESEVWQRVKFDVNNFLSPDVYTLLDDHIREYRDMQSGILPEYSDQNKIDFNIRLQAVTKIIKDIEVIEKSMTSKKKHSLI